ncbi:MAG TPA: hypothetical protein VGC98_02390 [Thermoleophilaceae bacterium]|jgi:hypothetical protein
MTEPRQTTRPPEGEAPAWWDEFTTGSNGLPPPRGFPDLSPLIAVVDALRRVVPVELQDQLNALQRELLLTIRALIDWYLERLDGAQRATVVEDIPID